MYLYVTVHFTDQMLIPIFVWSYISWFLRPISIYIWSIYVKLFCICKECWYMDYCRYRHSYSRTSIGSRTRCIDGWYFQWPWRTPNPVFMVMAIWVSNICKTVHFSDQMLLSKFAWSYISWFLRPISIYLKHLCQTFLYLTECWYMDYCQYKSQF